MAERDPVEVIREQLGRVEDWQASMWSTICF